MRVKVDRKADSVHLVLAEATVARREVAAPGVAVDYDDAGRIVGVAILEASRHSAAAAALDELRVDLSGSAARADAVYGARAPALAASNAPPVSVVPISAAVAPAPPPYAGPLTWDPEAEAAVAKISFFRRGPKRIGAAALARRRGLAVVTADIVAEAEATRR